MMNSIYKSEIDDELEKGLQLKSQDGLIDENGGFQTINSNNRVSGASKDEQYFDATDSLANPGVGNGGKKIYCRYCR
jgi:hypothetical protein